MIFFYIFSHKNSNNIIMLEKQGQFLEIARSASKHRNENFDTRARAEMCVIIVNAGTLCVHSFNGATFGKIGPIDQRL